MGAAADLRSSQDLRNKGVLVPPAWLFGTPPVGDDTFHHWFDSVTRDAEQPGAWNVANKYDPVTLVDKFARYWKMTCCTSYEHIGTKMTYKDGTLCEAHDRECYTYNKSKGAVSHLFRAANPKNHLMYLGLDMEHTHLP